MMALRRAVQLCGGANALGDTLNVDTKKLQDYCLRNPATPVMQATEIVFDIRSD